MTFVTPVVKRATKGTGTNNLSSAISSTGVFRISFYSSNRGGTLSYGAPGIDILSGIPEEFFLFEMLELCIEALLSDSEA